MIDLIYCFGCGKPLNLACIFTEKIICPECGYEVGDNQPERVLRKDGKPMFK
jgi:hypothetical protein